MVIIGAGRVSCELGPVWKSAGHDILQVVSRTETSAKSLGQAIGCPWTTRLSDASGALSDAEAVVIAVTDGLIAEIAEGISAMVPKSCVMLHLSGATPIEALRSPSAVVWPIRSFNPKATNVPLRGTPTVIEASGKEALQVAMNLASAWQAEVTQASGSMRIEAHLAAAIADNFANHMIAESQQLLDANGLPKTLLKNLVLGLAQGGHQGDSRDRQTGPAQRGDEASIERHRSLLPDDMKVLYDTVTRHIVYRHKG